MTDCLTDRVQVLQQEKVFVTNEATLGAVVEPVSADFVPMFNSEAERDDNEKLKKVKSDAPTNFFIENGQISGAFDLTGYFQPSGSLGVAPLMDKILSTLFEKTVNVGVSVEYKLKSYINSSISIHRFLQDIKESWKGCVPNKFEITAPDFLTAKISGICQDILTNGKCEVKVTAPITSQTIEVLKPYQFEVGAYVRFAADDNGGSGYLIDSIDLSGGTIHITTGLLVQADAGFEVAYLNVVIPSISDNILNYLKGSFKIDTVNYPIQNFMISHDEKTDYIREAYGEETPECIASGGNREVLISFDIPMRKSYVQEFKNKIKASTHKAIDFTFGTVAGKMAQLIAPSVKFTTPKTSGGDEGIVLLSLAGTALGSSVNGNDEYYWVFK